MAWYRRSAQRATSQHAPMPAAIADDRADVRSGTWHEPLDAAEATPLAGLKRVQPPARWATQRGFLARLFCADELADAGWTGRVAQINHTRHAPARQRPRHALTSARRMPR